MGKRLINADPAGCRLQELRILRDLQRRDSRNGNVRRHAQQMLAFFRAADLFVVGRRAIPAADFHGLPKMIPDFLQQRRQLLGNQDHVGAVIAGKFLHVQIRCERLAAVRFA